MAQTRSTGKCYVAIQCVLFTVIFHWLILSHAGVYIMDVVLTLVATNSAGSTQANATIPAASIPTIAATESPYGPFTLSQLIAVIVCGVGVVVMILLLFIFLTQVIVRRSYSTAQEEEILNDAFIAEIEHVVSCVAPQYSLLCNHCCSHRRRSLLALKKEKSTALMLSSQSVERLK